MEVILEHVYSILLEWEDSRVVEHAEQCYQPEDLARKNNLNVTNLELLLVCSLLSLASSCELLVELFVHDVEHQEADETYDKEHCAEEYGLNNACGDECEHLRVCHSGRHGEDCEHADTRDSHLETHSHSHLLTLEPLSDSARYGDTRHLATATEDHKAQACQESCARKVHKLPACECSIELRAYEPVANGVELDNRTDNHQ